LPINGYPSSRSARDTDIRAHHLDRAHMVETPALHLNAGSASTNHQFTMAASTSPTPLLLALLLLLPALAAAASLPELPLSTASRWVVGADGRRSKLACANWASHLEPAAAEGLARRGVGDIAARVAGMGFNCVRLTWPTYLATNGTLASLPFRWSLERLGMRESVAGVRVNNPALLDLPLIDVFRVRGFFSVEYSKFYCISSTQELGLFV
jgi:hypothetical protein